MVVTGCISCEVVGVYDFVFWRFEDEDCVWVEAAGRLLRERCSATWRRDPCVGCGDDREVERRGGR